MRYDECFVYETEYGVHCRGARAYHFEWESDGKQFTACEEHRRIIVPGLKKIPYRTDKPNA